MFVELNCFLAGHCAPDIDASLKFEIIEWNEETFILVFLVPLGLLLKPGKEGYGLLLSTTPISLRFTWRLRHR